MEDHFSVNVAERIAPDSQRFGPYHKHLFKVTIPAGRTKKEALEVFDDLCARYPEPQYRVTLSENIYRSPEVRCSGGKGST